MKKKMQAKVTGPLEITGGGVQITGCEFHLAAVQITDNALKAVEALSAAASANARAIEAIAHRLYGPEDNRIALKIQDSPGPKEAK
jgi:hypothetical protein